MDGRTPGIKVRDRPAPEKALAFLARFGTELTVVLSITELVDRTLNLLSEEAECDSCTAGLIDEPPKDTFTLVGAVASAPPTKDW